MPQYKPNITPYVFFIHNGMQLTLDIKPAVPFFFSGKMEI